MGGGGGDIDHLRGHQDHVRIFFVIFKLTLICRQSGQDSLFQAVPGIQIVGSGVK